MPIDTSWMQAALNQPQPPSAAEQQQSRNALALQGMQLQKAQMDLQDAVQKRDRLAKFRAAMPQGTDIKTMFDVTMKQALQEGDVDTAKKAREALKLIDDGEKAESIFANMFGAAAPTVAPAGAPMAGAPMAGAPMAGAPMAGAPMAAPTNALAPGAAQPSANAMAPGGPTRESVRATGLRLMALGDARGAQILAQLDSMFPETKIGEQPALVKLMEAASRYPVGSPQRRTIDAAIAKESSQAPRAPTEWEQAFNLLPPAEREKAVRAKLGLDENTQIAQTITDNAGNTRFFSKSGQEIIPTAPAAPGQVPTPVAVKGKPSAQYEKTQALQKQQSKDLNYAITELEAAAADGGLIDQSTGSGIGRAVDVAAGFVGKATPGAIAIGKLQPIADIVLKQVPRFEGPQSDKDTQSYKEAAGQLANASLPVRIRKEAAKTIIRLMKERKGQFVTSEMAAEGLTPATPPASTTGGVKFLGFE